MSDLVQRLRQFSAFDDCDKHEIATLHEAADEIERLTAELASARQDAARNLVSHLLAKASAAHKAANYTERDRYADAAALAHAAIDAAIGEKA